MLTCEHVSLHSIKFQYQSGKSDFEPSALVFDYFENYLSPYVFTSAINL